MRLFKRLQTASSLVLVSGCILCMAGGVWATRRCVDRIVAVVNDDVILASELGEAVSDLLFQLGLEAAEVPDRRAYEAKVLASMIDALLLIQDADEHDIVVSNADIKPHLEEKLERNRGAFASREEYEAELAKYGMTEKDFVVRSRKNLRDQIKIERLTGQVLAPRVEVREEEIRVFYDMRRAEIAEPTLVTLRKIAVAKRPSEESKARVKRKLEDLRAAALAGGDFAALAEALAAKEGGEFGRSFKFRPGEAVPEIESAVAELRPGDISPVTPGPDEYWLVRLLGIENDLREVQFVRLGLPVTEGDVRAARAKAEAALAALARGESFAEVAADYSENEDTAAQGGLVAEVDMAELEAEMPGLARAVASLSPGEVTPVVERTEGFIIVKLEERQVGRRLSYEEARDRIKRFLQDQKLALERKKYLQGLKEKSYIRTFD